MADPFSEPMITDDPVDDHVERRPFAAGPTILGFQAAGFGAAGIAALAGVGVGSRDAGRGRAAAPRPRRDRAGIAVSLSEGQPQAGGAAIVFDTSRLVLLGRPIAGLVTAALAIAVAAVVRLAPRLALTSRTDGRLELRDGLGPPRP